MQIILRGPAAGYEAEHTARLFFPDAEKTENLPQESDFVLAQSHLCTDTILLRLHGRLYWKIALRPQGADPEYTLCRLLYTLLGEVTGSTPPWGKPRTAVGRWVVMISSPTWKSAPPAGLRAPRAGGR